MTHILPICPCPTCGAKNNAATCVSNDESIGPSKGDVTLCVVCGELLVFDENVNPVLPSPQELKNIFSDPDVAAMIRTSQMMIRTIK